MSTCPHYETFDRVAEDGVSTIASCIFCGEILHTDLPECSRCGVVILGEPVRCANEVHYTVNGRRSPVAGAWCTTECREASAEQQAAGAS